MPSLEWLSLPLLVRLQPKRTCISPRMRLLYLHVCCIAGFIYPALLTALVPVRSYILDRCFDHDDLKHLDPYGETEEEYHEEQEAIHMQKNDSFSEDEMDFPNRAEFRAGGIQRELRHRHSAEAVSQTWPRANGHESTVQNTWFRLKKVKVLMDIPSRNRHEERLDGTYITFEI